MCSEDNVPCFVVCLGWLENVSGTEALHISALSPPIVRLRLICVHLNVCPFLFDFYQSRLCLAYHVDMLRVMALHATMQN